MKITDEIVSEMRSEIIKSMTRNQLMSLGFDSVGILLLQAAFYADKELEKECGDSLIPQDEFADGEIVLKELFSDWSVGQLTSNAGIKKLVKTLVVELSNALDSDRFYEASLKVNITPAESGKVKITLGYIKERND
jgi:hypothetical protein